MGWALDNLGASECERIALGLLPEAKPAGKRLQARCPFAGHDDAHPSFFYTPEDDYYKCYSHPTTGEEAGDLVDLWARLNGITDPAAALKEFVAQHAPHLAASRTRGQKPGPGHGPGGDRPAQGKSGARPHSAAPEPDKIVPEAELEAMEPLPEEWVQRLMEKRGWTRAVIEELGLRLWRPPGWFDDQTPRIAIPVRDQAGRLLNIRLYLPGAKQAKTAGGEDPPQKVKSYWTGTKKKGDFVSYGTPRLWPASSLGAA